MGKMAVVGFDHLVEHILAGAEFEAVDDGLALLVEDDPWEHQVVACNGHGVPSEVELHTLMTPVGVGHEDA